MEQKYFVIGGIVLLAVIFLAGVIFTPSGFLVKPGETQGIACMKLGTSSTLCEGVTNYWKQNSWKSKVLCGNARDEKAKSCEVYGCTCKYLPKE